jgi:hypothetical protein
VEGRRLFWGVVRTQELKARQYSTSHATHRQASACQFAPGSTQTRRLPCLQNTALPNSARQIPWNRSTAARTKSVAVKRIDYFRCSSIRGSPNWKFDFQQNALLPAAILLSSVRSIRVREHSSDCQAGASALLSGDYVCAIQVR